MNPLPHQPAGAPPPVFNCIVHVAQVGGGVIAHVANLAGIEGRGRTEREALAQVVPAFKARLAAYVAAGEPIPWIEPPVSSKEGETQRLIAVHL
jgi:hypothetical protein